MNYFNYLFMRILLFQFSLDAHNENTLIKAARVGNYDEVQKALYRGVNPNNIDNAGLLCYQKELF